MLEDSSENKPRGSKSGHLLVVASSSQAPGVVASTVLAVFAFLSPKFILEPITFLIAGLPISDNVKLFAYQLLFSVVALGIIAVVFKRYNLTFAAIGLTKRVKLAHVGKALTVLPIYFAVSLAVAAALIRIFPALKAEPDQNIGYSFGPGLDMVLVAVVLIVVAPLMEEIIFRGVLFRAYRRRFGFAGAALLVSALFAVAHGSVLVGADVFVLSLCLCYLRETTGSLWPCIALHGLKNLVAFVYLFIISMN